MDATHRGSKPYTPLTTINTQESIMADHDIQKSKQLLKRLDEEMSLLSTITAQINSLANQAHYVSTNIRGTWNAIDAIHKIWDKKKNKGEIS